MRQSSNRHTVVYRSWSASQARAVLRHPELLQAAPSIVPTSFGMLLMRLDVAKTRRESGVARTDGLKAPWAAQGSVATTCAIGRRTSPWRSTTVQGRAAAAHPCHEDAPRPAMRRLPATRPPTPAGCDRTTSSAEPAVRPDAAAVEECFVFTRSGVFHRCRLRVAPLQRRRTTLSQDETA